MAKITDVRIRKRYEDDSKTKAVVSATIDDMYVIHGIKVMKDEQGYFITMPGKLIKEGEYKDIFHPLNNAARITFQKEVMELFLHRMKKWIQSDN